MAQVVIAVRGGRNAKSRCAAALSGPDRARLTSLMLQDMLSALARCEDVSRVWVVTPTPDLVALAHAEGARTLRQPRAAGLNAAFRLAVAEVAEVAPYDPLVLMPGDLPRLAPDDLAAAVRLVRTHAVALAPSVDGGTGLVALRAGAILPPAFGACSFARHAAAAERRGLSVAVVGADSLSRDVDRPDDLVELMQCGAATRTAAFLRERLKPRIRS
jgi:2-phospho-L-lactate guanylyltransferase